jgi:CubicO group peptidase (beta-lactamase class C family)
MSGATTPAEFAERFPRTFAVFEQGRAKGLHLGAQVYVSVDWEVLADVGLGESMPGEPMTADHITHWLSAGKPLTAVLIGHLVEQGRVAWDDPVARFLPEFANRGKERITLRHILTHTAGLRSVETGWPDVTWEETIARICAAPLDDGAIPGETAAYHTASTWFVLGEVIQRVTGRPYGDVLREQLCEPAGMTHTVATLEETGATRPGSCVAPLWERAGGELKLLDWHLPPRSSHVSPGSSLRGPIRDLGRFYEMLLRSCPRFPRGDTGGANENRRPTSSDPPNPPLAGGAKSEMLQPATVATMIDRHRSGCFDQTLMHVVDYGLGFIIDSNRYGADTVPYGYGRYCSPSTFGHGGAQSSQGYCDPEHGLVVAYVFNGRPGEGQHQRRARTFNEAVYADLGIGTKQHR